MTENSTNYDRDYKSSFGCAKIIELFESFYDTSSVLSNIRIRLILVL